MPKARISDQCIHYRIANGCAVVRPEHGCDAEVTEALARLVNSSLIQSKHLIIDLSRSDYVETPGYRWIVRQVKQLESNGKKLIVTGMQPPVLRMFKLLKLDTSITVAKDVSEALLHCRTKQHVAA